MWVVDNRKEQTKIYLRSDIESSITNLSDVSNQIQESIATINNAVGGSVSGADQKMMDDCKLALEQIQQSLNNLTACRELVQALETRMWVNDK